MLKYTVFIVHVTVNKKSIPTLDTDIIEYFFLDLFCLVKNISINRPLNEHFLNRMKNGLILKKFLVISGGRLPC